MLNSRIAKGKALKKAQKEDAQAVRAALTVPSAKDGTNSAQSGASAQAQPEEAPAEIPNP